MNNKVINVYRKQNNSCLFCIYSQVAMGRNKANAKKGAGAGAGGAAAGKASAKPALNKSKKAKNVFKVTNNKGKKKPKEVQGKLKQVSQANHPEIRNSQVFNCSNFLSSRRLLRPSRRKQMLRLRCSTRIWSLRNPNRLPRPLKTRRNHQRMPAKSPSRWAS